MTIGLRLRDPTGKIVFDTTTRTARIIGIQNIAANTNGGITVTKAAGEKLFAILRLNGQGRGSINYVSTSAPGTPLSPDNAAANRILYTATGASGILIYGVRS